MNKYVVCNLNNQHEWGGIMSQIRYDFNRKIKLAIAVTMAMVFMACYNPLLKTENLQTATSASPGHFQPTNTEQALNSPTSKVISKKKLTPLPTAIPDNTTSLFEGNFNGVKYSAIYPGDFFYISQPYVELFCLKEDDSLCVSIHPSNGNWTDAKAMADEAIKKAKKEKSNLDVYQQKNILTASDGLPAFWVGGKYSEKGIDYESIYIFIVMQHIGFEIVADGEAQKVEAYREILNGIMNSFSLEYN
jgi:hypothetical protein